MDGSITGYPPQRNSIMITLRIYSSLWMLARRGFPLPPSPKLEGCRDSKPVYSIRIVEVGGSIYGIVRCDKVPASALDRSEPGHEFALNGYLRIFG